MSEAAVETKEVPVAAPTPQDVALSSKVEAILLSTDRPLQAERLAAALRLIRLSDEGETEPGNETARPTGKPSTPAVIAAACEQVAVAVKALNADYEKTGRAFRIEQIAGGFRVMTLPQFAETIAEFHRSRMSAKLTRAAIETLAIIAYKQPITRAQLEAIRGVSCGEVLKSLMERRIITIKGRAEELGRPMLYGTTKQFLDHFGLASIKDLPTTQELRPTP
ncbi:MAG: SMC-Scp complex subunit ScpB [Planctomycetota bacterium]|nr:SMC-Scp complex subunit ScpB [Planctomycetota bacterium]